MPSYRLPTRPQPPPPAPSATQHDMLIDLCLCTITAAAWPDQDSGSKELLRESLHASGMQFLDQVNLHGHSMRPEYSQKCSSSTPLCSPGRPTENSAAFRSIP
ncbi:unnamed protein product [Cercospora beticola]|nr:unnamed protein product [Cercospora beticola]